MEKDRKYFNELMDCYKLKKDTEEGEGDEKIKQLLKEL